MDGMSKVGVRAEMPKDFANTKILSENGEQEILEFVAKPKVEWIAFWEKLGILWKKM